MHKKQGPQVAGGGGLRPETAARDLPEAPPAPKRAQKHPKNPQSSGRTLEGHRNLYHNRSKISSFFLILVTSPFMEVRFGAYLGSPIEKFMLI